MVGMVDNKYKKDCPYAHIRVWVTVCITQFYKGMRTTLSWGPTHLIKWEYIYNVNIYIPYYVELK